MIRGTTATFKFNLPHKLRYIKEAQVVFWQDNYGGTLGNSLPIKKKYQTAHFTNLDSNELVVVLTSEETKAFTDKLKARVQMKALNDSYLDETTGQMIQSAYFGSQPQLFTVYPMDDAILDKDDVILPTTPNDEYIYLDGGSVRGEGDI